MTDFYAPYVAHWLRDIRQNPISKKESTVKSTIDIAAKIADLVSPRQFIIIARNAGKH